MLAPLTRITEATRLAANGSLSDRIRLPGRTDEFRELPMPSTPWSSGSRRTSPSSRGSPPTPLTPAHTLAITQTLLDVAREDPDRDTGELVCRLRAVNARAIDLTEALLLLSRADGGSFTRAPVDLFLAAEEATETLLPIAENHGVAIETSGDVAPTIGSPALLLQMTTNLLHNAIVHNLPDRGSGLGHHQCARQMSGAHGREHRREAHPTPRLHAVPAVPARHRTDQHGPRRHRPRPGDRRVHRPGAWRKTHLTSRPAGGLCVTVRLPAAPLRQDAGQVSYSSGTRIAGPPT